MEGQHPVTRVVQFRKHKLSILPMEHPVKRQLAFGFILITLTSLACRLSLTPPPEPVTPPPPTATITLTPIPTETATPTPTATPPLSASTGPALQELHMFSTTRGWGLTEDQILITRDGALTWAQVPLPNTKYNPSVISFFSNADVAYFFFPAKDTQFGQLFVTIDGGANWAVAPTPFGNAKLYFPESNVGFAMQTISADNDQMKVAIYQTLNRGTAWTQVFANTADQGDKNLPAAGIKTGMSFIDPSQGFIGLLKQENDVGLYHAEDAGRNWVKQTLSLPDHLGDAYQSTVLPPFFVKQNRTDGFLPVDFQAVEAETSTRVFYITHDAGVTWIKGGEVPNCIIHFFADPQTGWAWGEQGLYGTTDGAATWQPLPAAFGRSERAKIIDFVDPQDGWILTVDTKNVLRMYRTIDGGATWTIIIS